MRIHLNRDDQEDIAQMSKNICNYILDTFDGNEIFICLNSLTNITYVVLEEIAESKEEFKGLIDNFCKSLVETYESENE